MAPGADGLVRLETSRLTALFHRHAAVKDVMAKQGNTIRITTPEQAQAAFRSELAKYAALVRKVGLEPQ